MGGEPQAVGDTRGLDTSWLGWLILLRTARSQVSPPRARVCPPTWHAVRLAQQLPVHSHQLRGGGVQRIHCLRILQGTGNREARVAGHSWVHAGMREERTRG